MTLTESLRERLCAAMGRCPTCGRGGLLDQREVACRIGTSVSTVCRFLQGKGASSDFLDKLEAWLRLAEAQGRREEGAEAIPGPLACAAGEERPQRDEEKTCRE